MLNDAFGEEISLKMGNHDQSITAPHTFPLLQHGSSPWAAALQENTAQAWHLPSGNVPCSSSADSCCTVALRGLQVDNLCHCGLNHHLLTKIQYLRPDVSTTHILGESNSALAQWPECSWALRPYLSTCFHQKVNQFVCYKTTP